MRVLFLLLVLANVAFFGWSRYLEPAQAADGVLARQHEPERLKIVPPAPQPAPKPAAKAVPLIDCIEWGGFALADYMRAEQALEPLALGPRISQRRSEDAAGWWVFIPPQGSRQGALKKAAELKALGVKDYFILGEENEQRWALSLGVFGTEHAAQAHLDALRAQGVRSAQLGLRDGAVSLWLQVRGIDAALQARLKDIAREMQGSELRNCR